jgi:hypothetical protein
MVPPSKAPSALLHAGSLDLVLNRQLERTLHESDKRGKKLAMFVWLMEAMQLGGVHTISIVIMLSKTGRRASPISERIQSLAVWTLLLDALPCLVHLLAPSPTVGTEQSTSYAGRCGKEAQPTTKRTPRRKYAAHMSQKIPTEHVLAQKIRVWSLSRREA